MSELKPIAESGKATLYEVNGFKVPVLTGSHHEMGAQYGKLMVDDMQKAYDVVVQPQLDAGSLTEDDAEAWTERAVSTFSTRNKSFYSGMVEGTGWPEHKVGILDQINELGVYQSKLHSFAGCTSIFSWGGSSSDGGMYIGRNMDWSAAFNKFPQTLTVLNPTDGSYRYANYGWPGMINVFTALNEHGVYMDLHDGTSMGGSVVYEDRPPFLNALTDMLAESASLAALVRRMNAGRVSFALILSLADESSAASMECSGYDNRARLPDGDSFVTTNTFMNPDWGMHKRDTVSHSLERFANMADRLGDNHGDIDAAKTRELMDLTLFDADGKLAKNGGATKPTKIDADQTTHQLVADVAKRQVWLKVPNPDYFADWTHIDLAALWNCGRLADNGTHGDPRHSMEHRPSARSRQVSPPQIDTEKARARLLEERARITSEIESLQGEIGSLQRQTSAEHQDEEIGGGASFTLDREIDRALDENAKHILEAIDAALKRLDDGTYGICTNCGKPISAGRLEARPYAELCMECV